MKTDDKIKILHVIYTMGMGGAERTILNYAKYFNENRFSLYVCALTEGGPYENGITAYDISNQILDELNNSGIKYYLLNKRRGFDFKVLPKVINMIRSEKIDIVHLHDESSRIWVTIPAIFNGVKTIMTNHSVKKPNNDNTMSKIKKILIYFLSLFQKQIIAVSEEVLRTHTKKNKLFSNKFITIHNGIDPDLFNITINRDNYLKEFNLPNNEILIGITARFVPLKAHEVFLEAVQMVISRGYSVRGLLLGTGHRRKELEDLCIGLGISDRVVFTGFRNDVPQILNLIDIFVLSSDWEGFPMTVLEAMACGKPVVATDVGGVREAVIDGETGFTVPPRNPTALCEAIIKIIDDPVLRRKMGKKGRERLLKNFTGEVMVKKTEKIYEKLIMS